ncbi:hypothetical protein OF83DRAFT_1180149 [Amylostereum chailletii]|nr:hypothetical protein OF83DRAFT_1180149 [Amylostereum chailletii]
MSKSTTGATRRRTTVSQRRDAIQASPRVITPPKARPAQPAYETYREHFTRIVQKRYPNITPKNDMHLFMLARDTPDKTPEARIERLAKERTRTGITLAQARKKVLSELNDRLEQRATVYGLKPEPGEEEVHYLPLPDTKLDIRVWGKGLAHKHKYCLDFVDKATREPVNSPRDFELWAVPQLNMWWLPSFSGKCQSAEVAFGVDRNKISPGQEKYLVTEGASYRLVRKGLKDVFFTIPMRPVPQPAPYWLEDAQIISFSSANP